MTTPARWRSPPTPPSSRRSSTTPTAPRWTASRSRRARSAPAAGRDALVDLSRGAAELEREGAGDVLRAAARGERGVDAAVDLGVVDRRRRPGGGRAAADTG